MTATLRMDLVTGGQVSAEVLIRVFSSGATLAARVTPNPFNPRATLSFRTTRAGFAWRGSTTLRDGSCARCWMSRPSPGVPRGAAGRARPVRTAARFGDLPLPRGGGRGTSGGRVVLLK